MSDRLRGWLFVVVQAVLLVTIVALPGGDDWPTPSWLRVGTTVLFVTGVGLGIGAALGLGTSLTPTPVPSGRAELKTGGLYRFVRHPMYTAVLMLIVSITARSGDLATLAVGVVTVMFFNVKAHWEEQRLLEAYPDYRRYASTTPRFVPFTRSR